MPVDKKRRAGYLKGYHTGRKLDHSIKSYIVLAFALGVVVEYIVFRIALAI